MRKCAVERIALDSAWSHPGAMITRTRTSSHSLPLSFGLMLAALCSLPAGCATERAASAPARGESVKPGINKDFLDPALNVERYVERFETESREIYSERAAILERVALKPGQAVADIGAGTGLYTYLFADAVGAKGKVYAVDIAAPFVERIQTTAAERGLAHVVGVQCAEDDVRLPPQSIDVAFVCDTYHHFEYPAATLASLHRALRPGGTLIVIDFHRIEGVTREWTLNHVRAGQDVFSAEIQAAGFTLEAVDTPPGLKENYLLRFRRR